MTHKYFRITLSTLTSTIDKKEEANIELVLKQFISQHDYFLDVWKSVSVTQKNTILEILAKGKVLSHTKKLLV